MGWGIIGDVWDAGKTVASGVGDFFSSGTTGNPLAGVAQHSTQSPAASLFQKASGYATGAFGWLGDPQNAQAANILGGIALGAGQYYSAEKDREAAAEQGRLDRELRRELLATELESQKIAPGERQVGGYVDNISNGLISNGILASAIEEQR
ncbi:hypothetical protein [Spiribacter onubensis]|uniref:DUF637 domain-containing protein n=1 Tax=Spiribacter onubensis TaxID=3122420 RepID=A0ABV3S6W2_9GAMM